MNKEMHVARITLTFEMSLGCVKFSIYIYGKIVGGHDDNCNS